MNTFRDIFLPLFNFPSHKIRKINYLILREINMSFFCHSNLNSIPDISKWNTSNVKNMSAMFSGLHSLISLPDI